MVRLEYGGKFLGGLDRVLPAVDRMNGSEDVHAGGEPFLDHGTADAFGLLLIGEHRIDADNGHRSPLVNSALR